jgi:DNA-binding NarL/FixJ family response regulator
MTICLVADDHALVRDALALAVSDLFDGAVVRTAHDYPSAWQQAMLTPQPEFITVDLSMPGARPVEGITRLFEIVPKARIIAITGVEDDALMLEVLKTGVCGFVPKTASATLISGALQLVKAGGTYLPPRLLQMADSGIAVRTAPRPNAEAHSSIATASAPTAVKPAPLTRPVHAGLATESEDSRRLGVRQIEVLQLMAAGLANKDIARRLQLSPATVKGYVAQLIAHFGAQNRTQAVTRARDLGLL